MTKVYIDNEEKKLDKNGVVHEEKFKINTKSQPLLSGIINNPVIIKEEFTGPKLSGTAEDIIAALNRRPSK